MIEEAIYNFFWTIIYRVFDTVICWMVSILYSFFEVFAGLRKVSFTDGSNHTTYDYLINIFFGSSSINTIYWGMALIGIVLCFGFTIMAVIKKMFDIDDKMKSSLGSILFNLFKSILTILLINFTVVAILNLTNGLMQQVVLLFDNNELISKGNEITFEDDDYATMARILNTIGNYSLNPTRDSKYNINSCFNDIRNDMAILQRKGVFKFSYEDYEKSVDEDGNATVVYKKTKPSWQSALLAIARAHTLSEPQPLDEYDQKLTEAILECMKDMEQYKDFGPLTYYKTENEKIGPNETPIDAIIFLSGTTEAAKNDTFNENVSIFDDLRYDYIRKGGKSIYAWSDVSDDFNMYKIHHLMIILVGLLVAYLFLNICINCVARIFNMLILYIMAPPFIATTPLDDGEKAKQWWTAFIIQTFSVFGSVIGIRLIMIVIPIIFSNGLVLFDNMVLDFLAKIVMLVAVIVAVDQASKLITGILANNAGMQSLYAADVGSAGMKQLKNLAGGAARATGLRWAANAAESGIKASGFGKFLGYGKGSVAGMDKMREKAEDKAERQKEREEEEAKKKEEAAKNFQVSRQDTSGASAAGNNSNNNANNNTKPITPSSASSFSITSGGSGSTTSSSSSPSKSVPNTMTKYNNTKKS